jgi:TonB family protein
MSTPFGAAAQPGGAVVQPREPEEAPAPPPPPVITPPVVTKDEGAEYPAQAIADKVTEAVEISLVLEVDPTGAVRSATVESPAGHGFDEAAVEAAQKLRFEPATRNGQPIAAKIRHKYVFTPPPSRLIGRVTSQVRDTPIAGAEITLVGASGERLQTTTASDGTWRLEGVPAGAYTLTVAAGGFRAQSFDETVDAGEETQLAVRLARPVEIVPPPPGIDEGDIEEVRVRGTRPPREVTKRTLEQRELRRMPGSNGDPLRALQNLPGIARPPGLAGLLIVRGAAPQETGTFVDGTYVPIIYHFGGLSSVIPAEMLERIDFYPGNFSSYFGRFTGGVIDVGVKDPTVKKDRKVHGLAQVDLIDARVLAEGPIGKTGWNFAVGGRRSHVDSWLGPVLEASGAGVSTAPVYYDYQLMVQRDFGKKHSLRFFVFGSDDRLQILTRQVAASNPGLGGNVTLGTAFYRFQARYVGKLSDSTELRVVAAAGKDALQFELGDNFFLLSSYPVNPRVELSHKISQGVRNNFGFDVLWQPYEVDARFPPPPRPGEPPPGPFGSRPPVQINDSDAIYRPAVYDELELTPFRGTRIVPGVRLDYAKDTKGWDVQPRVSARQDLTRGFPRTTLKGGVGRFAQAPLPQQTNPVFGNPPGLRSTIANHYGFGGEQEITRQLEVSSEAFLRQYDGIITQRLGNVGEGRAYGLETLIRYKPDARFFGFFAYTLSRSVRRDAPGEPERLFPFDQTHILTAIGSYRLGGGWEIGARFRLISGNLRTPQTYGFYDLNVGAYQAAFQFPPFGERNPMFHQLDVRLDKSWVYAWGRINAYLDVFNAYNQGNVEGVSYNYNHTQSTFVTGVPILPSLGLRVEM